MAPHSKVVCKQATGNKLTQQTRSNLCLWWSCWPGEFCSSLARLGSCMLRFRSDGGIGPPRSAWGSTVQRFDHRSVKTMQWRWRAPSKIVLKANCRWCIDVCCEVVSTSLALKRLAASVCCRPRSDESLHISKLGKQGILGFEAVSRCILTFWPKRHCC